MKKFRNTSPGSFFWCLPASCHHKARSTTGKVRFSKNFRLRKLRDVKFCSTFFNIFKRAEKNSANSRVKCKLDAKKLFTGAVIPNERLGSENIRNSSSYLLENNFDLFWSRAGEINENGNMKNKSRFL